MHKARLIEYNETLHRARISPLGIKEVETPWMLLSNGITRSFGRLRITSVY
jgi:hypothetical protein